ncbi:PEN family class A beta-lactamase, Bpc-type [Actinomadura vinacea]|uniref:PEN family class A beta-lactamase, Bpc-type n=2 Tax=Actinomadura vinacea TaxID=115336 RepID=A0ABN3KAU2_9ACTN
MTTSALLASACATSAPAVQTGAAKPVARTGGAVPARITANPELQRRLQDLEASYKGRIGAAAIDVGTGKAVGYRASERFPFNSMFKAYACAAVLRKARDTDPGLLDRIQRWKPEEVLENSPETREYADTGLTAAQLCRAAVTKSDGFAGNLLLRQIGGPAGLTRYFRSLGDPLSRLDRYEPDLTLWKPGEERDTTTPAAAAGSLSRITVGDALDARDRERLVGWLRGSLTGNARIRAGLPKDWTVGDKTGTGGASNYGTANDIAIAWPPGSSAPIIISVLTNRNTNGVAADDQVIASTATALAEALGRL